MALVSVITVVAVLLAASVWESWRPLPDEEGVPPGGENDFWIHLPSGLDSPDLPSSIPFAVAPVDGLTGLLIEESPDVLSRLERVEGPNDYANLWLGGYSNRGYSTYWNDDVPKSPTVYETSLSIGPVAGVGGVPPPTAGISMSQSEGVVYYLLLREGGLTVYSLENRSSPRLLSRLNVPGGSIGMAVSDNVAYILTRADYSYALDSSVLNWEPARGVPQYRIGSQLLVVDLTDPSAPRWVQSIGFEGFVTEACTIGGTLYLFSNCYGFYRQATSAPLNNTTKVSAVSLASRAHPSLLGDVTVSGVFRAVHVAGGEMFIAHAVNTITIVDPMDGLGPPIVRGRHVLPKPIVRADCISLNGDVLTVSSADDGTLYHQRYGTCDVWTLDVSDEDDIVELGHIALEDFGTLGSTLYSASTAYLIMGGRRDFGDRTEILTINLSDPHAPDVVQTLALPATIYNAYVVGPRILASAMRKMEYPHIIEFHALLMRIEANGTLTIKEDVPLGADEKHWLHSDYFRQQAMLLCSIPETRAGTTKGTETVFYKSVPMTVGNGTDRFVVGRGITYSPDIGWVQQIWSSTDGGVLVGSDDRWVHFIDATDSTELVYLGSAWNQFPYIEDARFVGRYLAVLDYDYPGTNLLFLNVHSLDGPSLGEPVATLSLGGYVQKFIWYRSNLVVFRTRESGSSCMTVEITVVDLSDPTQPRLGRGYTFEVRLSDAYASAHHLVKNYERMGALNEALRVEGNPVIVDGQVLVLAAGGVAYCVDLRDPLKPRGLPCCKFDHTWIGDIKAVGHMVYVTDTEPLLDPKGDSTGQALYWLTRIDLRDPTAPSAMTRIRFPGDIVGMSNDGRTFYTTTHWGWKDPHRNGSYRFINSLNIVRLDDDSATIISAIECNWDELVIEDERAFVSLSNWDTSRPWLESDSPYDWAYEYYESTTIIVFDLSDPKRPEVESNLTVFGGFQIISVSDGVVLLSSSTPWTGWGIVAMDLSHGTAAVTTALFDIPHYPDVLGTGFHPYMLINGWNWGFQVIRP